MNTTQISSRLRFLASECGEESRRHKAHSNSRANLMRLAYQLEQLARDVISTHDKRVEATALAWLDVAVDALASVIAERVTDLAIDEVLHG